MTPERFRAITEKYGRLRIAVVGDFCLDRYLEINPAQNETSIETGLTVYNVRNVRAQPGGAGTVLNNLAALGVGTIFPVGFAGEDGEGYELSRALAARPGVELDHFFQTPERHTFTYCKPLVLEPGRSPQELNRLDQKNWTPTPGSVAERLSAAATVLAPDADAFILLSQVDLPESGVVTAGLLATVRDLATAYPQLPIFADSRHSLRDFPPVIFKMNAVELAALTGMSTVSGVAEVTAAAANLARRNGRPVFVTLAERGIVGALPDGQTEHVPAVPVRGEIDIVGAGDSVTANLTVALAAGATLREALELANAGASIVVHQLGTTGTASVAQLHELLFAAGHP
jgi:rfaE bifunctional protein kinase chain/domain